MNFRTKLKDLLTVGSSNIFASLIAGLFWIYLARILSKTEYGELGYLISTATVASVVALLGLGVAVVVFGSKKENIFLPSFVIILISTSITAVIVYFLAQNFTVSILIIGMAIFEITLQGILSKQKYSSYSKYQLVRATTSVFLALIFYQIFDLNGILLGYFLGFLVILKELYPLIKNEKLEFSIIRTKIKFLIEVYITRISLVLFFGGDKLLIGALFGFSVLGSFFLASQYLLLLINIPKSIYQYLLPQESEGKKNKKIKIFSVLISGIISVISIIFVPFGVNTFFPTFSESILPMQIMSIGIIPTSIFMIQQSEFFGKEKSLIVLIGWILQTGVYFLLIVLLGSSFGLEGLAVGFVISTIVRVIFNFFVRNHVR